MKNRRFFIYSLPRSGSSWLSVFLSGPGSFCYHEPFADGDVAALEARWNKRPEQVVGAIDTSAHQRPLVLPSDCVKYVLHRHKHQIESSLRLKGWVLNVGEELTKLDMRTVDCIAIHHNWLCELRYLENIWGSITGGLPFDSERAEFLIEMNIQRTFASVKRRHETYRTA
jgi:hypothetical protein